MQIVLGLFWIVDAALQYQPFMFGNQFVPTYITANAAGQPEPVAWLITTAGHRDVLSMMRGAGRTAGIPIDRVFDVRATSKPAARGVSDSPARARVRGKSGRMSIAKDTRDGARTQHSSRAW